MKYAIYSFKDSAESKWPLSATKILNRVFCNEFGCTISSSGRRTSVSIILLSRPVFWCTYIKLTLTQVIYFYASELATKYWLLDLLWNEWKSTSNWNFLHKKKEEKNIGTILVSLQPVFIMRKKGLTEFFAGTCHSWRQRPCNQQGWWTTTDWGTQQHLGTGKSCLSKSC